MPDTVISAQAVRDALAARKIADYQRRTGRADAACRWAAMSEHTEVLARCGARWRDTPPSCMHRASMLYPMDRGHLSRSIQRMNLTLGLKSIRKTFGCGLRAILAETESVVLR